MFMCWSNEDGSMFFSPVKLRIVGLPQITVNERNISKAYFIPDKSYQYDII